MTPILSLSTWGLRKELPFVSTPKRLRRPDRRPLGLIQWPTGERQLLEKVLRRSSTVFPQTNLASLGETTPFSRGTPTICRQSPAFKIL